MLYSDIKVGHPLEGHVSVSLVKVTRLGPYRMRCMEHQGCKWTVETCTFEGRNKARLLSFLDWSSSIHSKEREVL